MRTGPSEPIAKAVSWAPAPVQGQVAARRQQPGPARARGGVACVVESPPECGQLARRAPRWHCGTKGHLAALTSTVARWVLRAVWCAWIELAEVALDRRLQLADAVVWYTAAWAWCPAFLHALLTQWKRFVDAAHRNPCSRAIRPRPALGQSVGVVAARAAARSGTSPEESDTAHAAAALEAEHDELLRKLQLVAGLSEEAASSTDDNRGAPVAEGRAIDRHDGQQAASGCSPGDGRKSAFARTLACALAARAIDMAQAAAFAHWWRAARSLRHRREAERWRDALEASASRACMHYAAFAQAGSECVTLCSRRALRRLAWSAWQAATWPEASARASPRAGAEGVGLQAALVAWRRQAVLERTCRGHVAQERGRRTAWGSSLLAVFARRGGRVPVLEGVFARWAQNLSDRRQAVELRRNDAERDRVASERRSRSLALAECASACQESQGAKFQARALLALWRTAVRTRRSQRISGLLQLVEKRGCRSPLLAVWRAWQGISRELRIARVCTRIVGRQAQQLHMWVCVSRWRVAASSLSVASASRAASEAGVIRQTASLLQRSLRGWRAHARRVAAAAAATAMAASIGGCQATWLRAQLLLAAWSRETAASRADKRASAPPEASGPPPLTTGAPSSGKASASELSAHLRHRAEQAAWQRAVRLFVAWARFAREASEALAALCDRQEKLLRTCFHGWHHGRARALALAGMATARAAAAAALSARVLALRGLWAAWRHVAVARASRHRSTALHSRLLERAEPLSLLRDSLRSWRGQAAAEAVTHTLRQATLEVHLRGLCRLRALKVLWAWHGTAVRRTPRLRTRGLGAWSRSSSRNSICSGTDCLAAATPIQSVTLRARPSGAGVAAGSENDMGLDHDRGRERWFDAGWSKGLPKDPAPVAAVASFASATSPPSPVPERPQPERGSPPAEPMPSAVSIHLESSADGQLAGHHWSQSPDTGLDRSSPGSAASSTKRSFTLGQRSQLEGSFTLGEALPRGGWSSGEEWTAAWSPEACERGSSSTPQSWSRSPARKQPQESAAGAAPTGTVPGPVGRQGWGHVPRSQLAPRRPSREEGQTSPPPHTTPRAATGESVRQVKDHSTGFQRSKGQYSPRRCAWHGSGAAALAGVGLYYECDRCHWLTNYHRQVSAAEAEAAAKESQAALRRTPAPAASSQDPMATPAPLRGKVPSALAQRTLAITHERGKARPCEVTPVPALALAPPSAVDAPRAPWQRRPQDGSSASSSATAVGGCHAAERDAQAHRAGRGNQAVQADPGGHWPGGEVASSEPPDTASLPSSRRRTSSAGRSAPVVVPRGRGGPRAGTSRPSSGPRRALRNLRLSSSPMCCSWRKKRSSLRAFKHSWRPLIAASRRHIHVKLSTVGATTTLDAWRQ